MTENQQTSRLSKVAKEFNIGLTTVIDFLNKKGFHIDSNPNTKISADMYEILVKEFQSEKIVKEESKKAGLGATKKETISIETNKVATDEQTETKDLFIKNIQPHIAEVEHEKETVKKEEVKKAKEEVSKIKVVGKIDLENIEPKTKSGKTAKTSTAKTKEKTKEVKETKEKKTTKTVETKETAKKKKEEVVVEEEVVEVHEKKKEKKSEEKLIEKVVEKIEVPEVIEEKPELKSDIKVIGKIDLDSINSKTKPAKKSKEEKEKERKEKNKKTKSKTVVEKKKVVEDQTEEIEKEEVIEIEDVVVDVVTKEEEIVVEKPISDEPDENFLKTQYVKLEGPTILGKMDLPVAKEQVKKPVASSSDDLKNKKKKRKRIKKDVKPIEQKPQESRPVRGKPVDTRKKKDIVKPDLTSEEIEKQIKETLARLNPTGKSKASKYRRQKRDQVSHQMQEEIEKNEQEKKVLKVTEFVSANELASMMSVPVTEVISVCMNMGMFVSINQRLDAETIAFVVDEFGYKTEFVSASVQEAIDVEVADDPKNLLPRAPIVTVMGHVDHGKTSLLDHIRKTNVIAGEAGGITQHIGAYEVKLENGKRITFLDTPGHEAFTAMRARGAKVTDIVIIVVAADDSVMPQTVEAINHAQAANVPIIIAINKIDKPGANSEKIKEQLANMNILVEDWGGKYQCQEISAKKGLNIDALLEKVLLEAEMLDLKANPSRNALGTVIESSLDKGRGYIAKLLVLNGTMHIGDVVLAGYHYGRVKAMYNERNMTIKEAGPGVPVLLLGLSGAPQAGDLFHVMEDEHEAKNIANKRFQLQREQGIRTQKHITLDEIGRRIAIGDFKELNIIVKGDVDGSVEALSDSLLKLSNQEVQVNVIHKSVGQVTESDVLLASASNAVIIGFQVRPSMSARKLAEQEQIDIRLYSIIYTALNEIKSAIEGMLSPEIEEKIVCNVEVRDVFKITKVGTVAGCTVLDGKIMRSTRIRVIRDGIVIYTGALDTLKRFKDDVKEVSAGYECGLNILNFNDIKVGDIIEGFEEIEVKRKL